MSLKKKLEKLIDTPVKDPYRRVRARYFNILVLIFGGLLIACSLILIVNPLGHPYETNYSMLNGIMAVSGVAGAFLLSKKGHFETGVYIFLSIMIIATLSATANRGLSFTIILIYAVCVTVAGLLVGTKSALAFTAGSAACYSFSLYWLYEKGRIAHNNISEVAIFNITTLVASLLVIATLTGMISRGFAEQLDEVKKARRYRSEQERRFKSLFETSTDALMILDHEKFLDCNRQTLELFGLGSKKEFVNTTPWELSPPIQPNGEPSDVRAKRRIKYAFEHGHNKFEWVHRKKCGEDFPAEVWLTSLELDGRPLLQATVRDISDRKLSERQLKDSIREKDVLLKEVHHRVKNNLQTVSSLLNLQSQNITDPAAMDIFKEGQSRIKSMALVHEKLYQAEELVHIDLGEYIEGLAVHLAQSFMVNTERIKVEIEVGDARLGLDRAITCGLILNELMTNSFKHAFTDGRAGRVRVSVTKSGDKINIRVSDDGIGMDDGPDFRKTDTLGLQLVNALVLDLGGVIEHVKTETGTEFLINFKE